MSAWETIRAMCGLFDDGRKLIADANRIVLGLPFDLKAEAELERDKEWRQELARNECQLSKEEIDVLTEYAKDLYEGKQERFRAVDKKAEWLFAIGMAVTGAILYQISRDVFNFWLSLPSGLCALAALAYLLKSRSPMEISDPMDPKAYCGFIKFENEQINAGKMKPAAADRSFRMADLMKVSAFNSASATLDFKTTKKSMLLRAAALMIVLATACSVLPLMHYSMTKKPPEKPKVHLELRSL